MNDGINNRPSARDLMEYHAEAMFTHDRSGRLHLVNEPWPGSDPAPRLFLGRTTEGGSVWRFRHDVSDRLVKQLESWFAEEAAVVDFQDRPKHEKDYWNLLQGERMTMGPCYYIENETRQPSVDVQRITPENVRQLAREGFEWLADEINFAQPCVAVVQEGRAVSVCRSVRIGARAHEAGLETLEEFRGRGYAAAATAGWAEAVRELGCIPLYSTSSDNLSSQHVAGKMGLSFYGVNFSIY
ncbi:GNAT family N-acetyltransferase [Paenibacillus cellulositrophicus]|uniref:GNAT family N-acetyltransferase n=2 Tax=Paenibacillus cellulositrophicus TaxID=562959 RepID=UPI00203F5114|nr:GNAT family N-acetyltransferase [Paenibacillus cellulositrophicus]MCM2998222.1 GNAT family N-acetyltransferase [Paenibacillus cellulositrophicus]